MNERAHVHCTGRRCLRPMKTGTSRMRLSPHFRTSELGFLAFALQGSLQCLVQGCLGSFVFLLADAALFMLDLELEEFILQTFKQLGWIPWRGRRGRRFDRRRPRLRSWLPTRLRRSGDFEVLGVFDLREASAGTGCALGFLLTRGDVDASADQRRCECRKNPPAIFLQRVGSVDRGTETAARTIRFLASSSACRFTGCSGILLTVPE